MDGTMLQSLLIKYGKIVKPHGYLIIAIVVHLIFSISIFDIYFKSTVIHGMSPHINSLPSPAKRLVLFVIDGLRADTFYSLIDNKKNNMFLRFIIENRGISGISHCQVPTESRTGHVALIAGMNEDVSAVLTGWTRNPVGFDSVFNESRFTWSWGSPDILPIFSKNAHRNHVFTHSYDADELDFASINPAYGDTWVFNKVENFLKSSKTNNTLSEMLSENQIVFFLHLIATDTLGHGKKPDSIEYRENIINVDKQIKHIVESIEKYFNYDEQTAFIVTADHGMTDHGSHGSGSWEETEVPIVTWGAGIRGPDLTKKYEIKQVDTVPLMSALIGVAYPMNSVGVLPLEYFNVSSEFSATSLFTNAMQLVSLSDANEELKKRTALTFKFNEYSRLTTAHKLALINRIQNFLSRKESNKAIEEIQNLINKSLDAIRYYETYDRTVLNITISMGFLFWMIYLISFILERYTSLWNVSLNLTKNLPANKTNIFLIPCIIIAALIIYLLKARQVRIQYYAYFFIPLIFLIAVYRRLNVFKLALKVLKEQSSLKDLLLKSVVTIFVLEVLVLAFFNRSVLSLGLLVVSMWSWFSPVRLKNKKICILWTLSIVCLSFFPLLPIVGTILNYYLVYVSGLLSLVFITYFALRSELRPHFRFSHFSKIRKKPELIILALQIFFLGLSILIKYTTIQSIENNKGLLLPNQILAWMILSFSFFLPLFSTTKLLLRLFHVYISVFPVYVMMSTSYEVIFLLLFCFMCLIWVLCEHEMSTTSHMKIQNINLIITSSDSILTFEDIRRACFFLLFIFTAFFGTGNIASLSSFDAVSLFCFITVFHPFPMAVLLVLKVIIPFIVVTCSFYSIITVCRIQVWSLFSLVLFMSDFMSLHMFLMVQDYGSWLEIGSSISRYILMISVTIFLILLYFFSQILMTKTLHTENLSKIRKN